MQEYHVRLPPKPHHPGHVPTLARDSSYPLGEIKSRHARRRIHRSTVSGSVRGSGAMSAAIRAAIGNTEATVSRQ